MTRIPRKDVIAEGSAESLWAEGRYYEACMINPFIRFEPGNYRSDMFTPEEWQEIRAAHAERMKVREKK